MCAHAAREHTHTHTQDEWLSVWGKLPVVAQWASMVSFFKLPQLCTRKARFTFKLKCYTVGRHISKCPNMWVCSRLVPYTNVSIQSEKRRCGFSQARTSKRSPTVVKERGNSAVLGLLAPSEGVLSFTFGAPAFDHTLWERLTGLAPTLCPHQSTAAFLGFAWSDSGLTYARSSSSTV